MSNIDSLSIKKVSAVAPKVPIITDNFEINDYETKDISTSSSVVNADGSINLDTFIDSVDIQDYETGEVQGSLGIKTTHQETEGEKKPWYEAALNFLEDTAATVVEVSTSFVKGIANVGEDIVDGVAMLGGNVVVAGATICNWAGADIDVEGIKEGVSDFVETEHINDLYDSTVGEWDWVQDNSYASDTALGIAEGVGTMVGYAAVSALPGAGGSIVAGLGAAGSASESAFQNGASFEGATLTGAAAFGAGVVADAFLDKIGVAAKGSRSRKDILKYTLEGIGAGGAIEPGINNAAQYVAYGMNMVDEEGNPLYDKSIGGFFDFATDNGMWYDVGIGAAIGGGRSFITSEVGLNKNRAEAIDKWKSYGTVTEDDVRIAKQHYSKHRNYYESEVGFYETLAYVEGKSQEHVHLDTATGRWEVLKECLEEGDPGLTSCITEKCRRDFDKVISSFTAPDGRTAVHVGYNDSNKFLFLLGKGKDYGTLGYSHVNMDIDGVIHRDVDGSQFVTPGLSDPDGIINAAQASTTRSIVEEFEFQLGIDNSGSDKIILVDYSVERTELGMHTGKEFGSNSHRLPGGLTPNNQVEAVHQTIHVDDSIAKTINVTIVSNDGKKVKTTLAALKNLQRKNPAKFNELMGLM